MNQEKLWDHGLGAQVGLVHWKRVSAEGGISFCIIDHHIPSLVRGIGNRIGRLPNFNK